MMNSSIERRVVVLLPPPPPSHRAIGGRLKSAIFRSLVLLLLRLSITVYNVSTETDKC